MHYTSKALKKHGAANPDRDERGGNIHPAIRTETNRAGQERRILTVRDTSRWTAHQGERECGRYVQTGAQVHRKPRSDR